MIHALSYGQLVDLHRLSEIEGTPAPWWAPCVRETSAKSVLEVLQDEHPNSEIASDLWLIVKARNALPRLLAEVAYWRAKHGAPPRDLLPIDEVVVVADEDGAPVTPSDDELEPLLSTRDDA